MKLPEYKASNFSDLPFSTEKKDQVDNRTWQEFKDGDEDAFIKIYQEYFVSLYRYGTQFVRSKALIQDTIQDLFIDLRSSRNKLNISKIRPYLFVSFRRRLVLKLKEEQNKVLFDTDLLEGYHFNIETSTENKIIDSQQIEIDHVKLKDAINGLTDRQREAIYLYYFEDLSYKELKELLTLKDIKSARNLIYKAINSLRDSFISLVSIIAFSIF